MTKQAEIEAKFWKALKSDRTAMLGLVGVDDGRCQPMTAQIEGDADHGPIWFFSAKDTDLAKDLGSSHRGVINFAAKGHALFAAVTGTLTADNDRRVIDRLWNPFIAAWYQGGKDDPNLQLLRFDAESAQIWLNETSLLAGVKILLGSDPKKDHDDKVAVVALK
ncbi:MAG: pyridoxamine 5'-phosphate oxidase family protein [Alphaproteobacteria bacterium]|nr:pyridoxamine 5'-phosphate oxidase family protein [Alphaproteobacteria bacterium]